MNNKITKMVLTAIFLLSCLPSFETVESFALDNEALILAKIGKKIRSTYEKYLGVQSKRDMTNILYDARTGELLKTYNVSLIRKEYFYKKPENIVLKYFKNGKELPASEYNYNTREPLIPPFDKNSEKNYNITLTGRSTIAGQTCYEVTIVPKIDTPRHLSGKAYFDVKTLNLCYLQGTIAKYPFGLKNLSMHIYFKKFKDSFVISHGTMIFDVHVPILFKNKRIVSKFKSSEEKLIHLD
jgi:hypothetical protein